MIKKSEIYSTHDQPSRWKLTGLWSFISVLLSTLGPIALSPGFFLYCLIKYDIIPIIGSNGWFLSHFFGEFGNYYIHTLLILLALCSVGLIIILARPTKAHKIMLGDGKGSNKNTISFNTLGNGRLNTGDNGPHRLKPRYRPSESVGSVYVRGHWRRKPRR